MTSQTLWLVGKLQTGQVPQNGSQVITCNWLLSGPVQPPDPNCLARDFAGSLGPRAVGLISLKGKSHYWDRILDFPCVMQLPLAWCFYQIWSIDLHTRENEINVRFLQ